MGAKLAAVSSTLLPFPQPETHHEPERDEREARDEAPEPEELAIGDQDDGEVLEDGVDGDGEVLLRAIERSGGGSASEARTIRALTRETTSRVTLSRCR